jgi:LEA14-like dessication related protein
MFGKKLRLPIVVAILSVCLTPACKTIRDVQLERITDVRIVEINPNQIEIDLGVELRNTRSYSGQVHDLLCDISLTGHTIGQGHQPDSLELPSHTLTVVHLPITVDSTAVTREDFDSIFEPEIPYTLIGTAVAEKPFKVGTVKLDVHGKFKGPEVIPVTLSTSSASDIVVFRGLTIKEVGLLESTGALQLTIHNPLRFPVTMRGFQYEAISGGARVADGDIDHDLVLNAGSNEVDLPVRLHLAGIAGGILSGMSQLRLPDVRVYGLATLREKERTLQIQFGVEDRR